ncbi:MAG: universal stress protein [Candidatus Natronoplasma sp.]
MEPNRRKKEGEDKELREKVSDTGKKVMKRKKEERSEAIKTLLIASYRERYPEESLDAIRQIIEQEQPEKIIILKLIKEKPSSELVDASMGIEEKKDFLESVREEKRNHADWYAEPLIELIEAFDIPSEVHLRKGESIAAEIIEEFESMDVDHIILHGAKKGPLGKVMEGSVSENVKKGVDTRKVTMLD